MKPVSILLILLSVTLTACGQAPTAAAGQSAHPPRGSGVLTGDEVGAILGSPVTSVEGAATDMAYKTATLGLETTVGVEVEDDSEQAMAGARKATSMLGGAPETVPNLGDEAFFGAMSVLYVRKGDNVITISPPNYQQIGAMAAYAKMTEAKMGSPEQAEALKNFAHSEQADPLQAGLKGGDAVQGALATVAATSAKQGTPEEARGRGVAVSLAAKVLSKL
jgi:hypothetical protein